MNRVHFLLKAKNQYSIQSPFLYELYSEVIAPRLSNSVCSSLGISGNDVFGQVLYKMRDHYGAAECEGCGVFPDCQVLLVLRDGSHAALFNHPHRSDETELAWNQATHASSATMAVDLFYVGIIFDSVKLSKQQILLYSF